MEATNILSAEHRVIEVVLSVLENIAGAAVTDGKLDGESAGEAIDFIRNFADSFHHMKEEDILFTAMAERGIPAEGGPIGVMLAEHDQGRGYVKGMIEQTEAATAGDSEAVEAFARNARHFVGLLRDHIQKEDNILYPMAPNVLSGEDQENMLIAFAAKETEQLGEGTREKYMAVAKRLAERFEVNTQQVSLS